MGLLIADCREPGYTDGTARATLLIFMQGNEIFPKTLILNQNTVFMKIECSMELKLVPCVLCEFDSTPGYTHSTARAVMVTFIQGKRKLQFWPFGINNSVKSLF